jgi:hypothetical protein
MSKNTENKISHSDTHEFPAHLVQSNRQKTKLRFPTVRGFNKGDLVKVPSGETLFVGDVLMRDRGKEKRSLHMTEQTGGSPVFPIFANSNAFA